MNIAKHTNSLKSYPPELQKPSSNTAYAILFRWAELHKIQRSEIFVAIVLCEDVFFSVVFVVDVTGMSGQKTNTCFENITSNINIKYVLVRTVL